MEEYIIIDDCLPEEVKLDAKAQGYLKELVRCKNCKYLANMYKCPCFYSKEKQPDDWFCADGKREGT